MLDALSDPNTKPGDLFVYGGFDADASVHLLTDDTPEDPWLERFPVGRTAIMALPRSRTARIRFEMMNLDNDDSDVWAGHANAMRCLVDPTCFDPKKRNPNYPDNPPNSDGAKVAHTTFMKPQTFCLKALSKIAVTQSQKRRIKTPLKLERALRMRNTIGFQCHGRIDRLKAEYPLEASVLDFEARHRWKVQMDETSNTTP